MTITSLTSLSTLRVARPTPTPTATPTVDGTSAPSATALALTRRLRRALADLGLAGPLGDGVAAGADGIDLGHLAVRDADRLVCRLEDLVAGVDRTGSCPAAGRGEARVDDSTGPSDEQLTLFDAGDLWGSSPITGRI